MRQENSGFNLGKKKEENPVSLLKNNDNYFNRRDNGTDHFYIEIDYRGNTEKGAQFIMTLMSIRNKNFCFL